VSFQHVALSKCVYPPNDGVLVVNMAV